MKFKVRLQRIKKSLKRTKKTRFQIQQANLRHYESQKDARRKALITGITGSVAGVLTAKAYGANPLVGAAAIGIPAAMRSYVGTYMKQRLLRRGIYGSTKRPRIKLVKGRFGVVEPKATRYAPAWLRGKKKAKKTAKRRNIR